jgi:hypothetical protein
MPASAGRDRPTLEIIRVDRLRRKRSEFQSTKAPLADPNTMVEHLREVPDPFGVQETTPVAQVSPIRRV